MSGKRYSEEFKIEAVLQVTDLGYKVPEVAGRWGITTNSLYEWIKRYGDEQAQHLQISEQQREIRRLKARVDQERVSIVPTSLYFRDGKVKVELGVGKGRVQIETDDGDIRFRTEATSG